jgi:hypothetical protein
MIRFICLIGSMSYEDPNRNTQERLKPIKGRPYDRQTIHKGTMVNDLRRS